MLMSCTVIFYFQTVSWSYIARFCHVQFTNIYASLWFEALFARFYHLQCTKSICVFISHHVMKPSSLCCLISNFFLWYYYLSCNAKPAQINVFSNADNKVLQKREKQKWHVHNFPFSRIVHMCACLCYFIIFSIDSVLKNYLKLHI